MDQLDNIRLIVSSANTLHDQIKAMQDHLKPTLPYAVSHFCYGFDNVIRDFKEAALKGIAEKFINDNMPNTGLTGKHLYGELEKKDRDAFNVALLVEKLKIHQANSRELALKHIQKLAKNLVPWRTLDSGYRGEEQDPDNIRQGKTLILSGHTWSDGRITYYAHEVFNKLSALDKLARLVLSSVDLDPNKDVTNYVYAQLSIASKEDRLYGCKHNLGRETVQFYKNSKIKVTYSTEAKAEKVARALINGIQAELDREEGEQKTPLLSF